MWGKDQRDKTAISFCRGLPTFCMVRRLNLISIFYLSICPSPLSPHHQSSSIRSNMDFQPISALIFSIPRLPLSLLAICLFLYLSFSLLFNNIFLKSVLQCYPNLVYYLNQQFYIIHNIETVSLKIVKRFFKHNITKPSQTYIELCTFRTKVTTHLRPCLSRTQTHTEASLQHVACCVWYI